MFEFEFSAPVTKWQGKSAWYFIALPTDMSHEITRLCGAMKAGWGSLKVHTTIGATSWNTSIFPDKKRDAYLLPVKADVRKAEGIADGDSVDVTLSV